MYAAKPILMAGNIGDNIVELANCGLTTPPLDISEIKKAIISLKNKSQGELNKLGQNGKQYVIENNTIDKLCDRYIEIFEKIC